MHNICTIMIIFGNFLAIKKKLKKNSINCEFLSYLNFEFYIFDFQLSQYRHVSLENLLRETCSCEFLFSFIVNLFHRWKYYDIASRCCVKNVVMISLIRINFFSVEYIS